MYPCPPQGKLTEIPRGRGVSKALFLKESMTPKWNFRRGGGGGFQTKKPSVAGVWIFSGTTQSMRLMNASYSLFKFKWQGKSL